MSKTTDKIEKAGVAVASALSLWDRARGWWARRQEAKAEARRRKAAEDLIRTDVAMQQWSDELNADRGGCSFPGCERPHLHPGEHGRRRTPEVP